MATTYYASKISDNIGRTPEGFLICNSCVVGRTGFQRYAVRDLPQERAAELGVDISNPGATIDLYRTPEEVFAKETLASIEGKPVTDNHPNGFVTADNYSEFACGHIQNVRKGSEPLESGEWPIVADLIITTEPLISKVESGELRELSLGYDFSIDKDGDKILQTNILVNHCAVVPKGRAGAEARINDAAPSELVKPEPTFCHNCGNPVHKSDTSGSDVLPGKKKEVATAQAADASQVTHRNSIKGEVTVQKKTPSLMRRMILGLGLKTYALDADTTPEELAEAAEVMAEDATHEDEDIAGSVDRRAADRKAKDRRTKDRRADDACEPGEDGHERCTEDRCKADDRKADDRYSDDRKMDDRKADDRRSRDSKMDDHRADDKRSRLHDALDRMLDEHMAEGEDADLEELKVLLNEFLNEEEQEPEHQEDSMMPEEEMEEMVAEDSETAPSEILEPVGEAGEEEIVPANDSAWSLIPVVEKSKDMRVVRAFDAALTAHLEDEHGFLKAIRPAIARSNDQKVRAAFDAALQKYTRVSRASNGSYGAFASGATARANDSHYGTNSNPRTPDYSSLDAAYAQYKGKNPTEVKL